MNARHGTELSHEQARVVADSRPRVLVSAGAGSGKTRLLVAYFVRALLDEGVPVDRLVAVTFTRKAAGELADRIRAELQLRGRPDLAWSLEAATIGTIHSLCRRLIVDRSLETGIDPDCSVLEAEASMLLKEEVVREAWERVVERAGETELGVLASGREALLKQIGPLYDRLRGLGNERPQITVPPGPSAATARIHLVATIDRALEAVSERDSPGPTLIADLEKLRACLDWIQSRPTDHEQAAGLEETKLFFPSRGTKTMNAVFEPVREALTEYRLALAEIRLRPFVMTVNHLLSEFHQQYEKRKREQGLVDFADLELLARALTRRAVAGTPRSPVLPGAWVLIDEFQDTNEVQCSILDGLGAARLLMVGDRRQSIYRFRGADVAVFSKWEDDLGSRSKDDSTGVLHRLDTNYRSRPEILAFVNRLFAHPSHFGEGFKPLLWPKRVIPPSECASEQATCSGGSIECTGESAFTRTSESTVVEILVAERGLEPDTGGPLYKVAEAEAWVAADRIRTLLKDRGYTQRDIVILLPTHTYVDTYRQALLRVGLDVYVVRGKGYYSQEEVADVVSLLRLLINPHDDLAMMAVLRSPLVGVTDDALYHLGRARANDKGSMWEVVRQRHVEALDGSDRLLLDGFLERLNRLQPRVGRPGLARLVDDATSLFSYDLCLLGAPDGLRRFANVRKLMRMAQDFEALEGPDLAGFVDLVESMGDLSDKEGSAPILAETDDVIRVMTIHQAKGLEFPVVVLAGLGSSVFHGRRPDIVVGDDGRAGVFLPGSKRDHYEQQDLSWGPAAEIVAQDHERANEEDVRLMYVAMTRAEERLFLVGARPKNDELDDSRISRVIIGLGFDSLPPEGTSLPLEGLAASLSSVAASPSNVEVLEVDAFTGPGESRGSGPISAGVCTADAEGSPPEFVESTKRGGLPRQVSFSALAAYQQCPRRFYLERMLGLDLEATTGNHLDDLGYIAGADDDDGAGVAPERSDLLLDLEERRGGRSLGLLVHGLLERLPAKDGGPQEDLVRREADVWLEEQGVVMARADFERAVALTLGFWQAEPARLWSHPAAEREAPFSFARQGVLVSGIMDLVVKEDPCWRIVDYKTNALRGRTPAEVATGYDLQVAVYCLAALQAGAPAVQMDLVFLEHPHEPQTRRYGPDDIEVLTGVLDDVLGRLGQGEFPACVDDECTWCAVEAVCSSMACG